MPTVYIDIATKLPKESIDKRPHWLFKGLFTYDNAIKQMKAGAANEIIETKLYVGSSAANAASSTARILKQLGKSRERL